MFKDGPNVYPVPLRSDLTVRIGNIPLDMTEAEADKICRVVRALATPANCGTTPAQLEEE